MLYYKFIYSTALLLIFPFAIIYFLILSIRKRDLGIIKNRLGSIPKLENKNSICIHCSSLGEINGAKELITEIAKSNNILISTNTFSGKVRAQQLFPNLDVVYFPLDYKFIIHKWLKLSQIKNVLIYETEIWSNFYKVCASKKIKLCIINARIQKNLHKTKFIKNIYKEALKNTNLILCKSGYEREKYRKLGIDEENLLSTGNLKYSYVPDFSDKPSTKRNEKTYEYNKSIVRDTEIENKEFGPYWTSKKRLHFSNKDGYFLMASTHEPDEKYFLQGIKELSKEDIVTVIAPRHIKRANRIKIFFYKNGIEAHLLTDLAKGNLVLKRNFSGVIIIDTFGDLPKYYSGAKYVYVGGGYSKRGVQNIIEPSAYGKSILVGPNIENFYEEIINLRKEKGITIVEDNKSIPVQENITKYLKELNKCDNETLDKMGGLAKAYNLKLNGVLKKYIDILKEKKFIN
tara:strand:+ start:15 stop:1391 length:1377 start_codon:yes stop_codon:yes gene_type:complete